MHKPKLRVAHLSLCGNAIFRFIALLLILLVSLRHTILKLMNLARLKAPYPQYVTTLVAHQRMQDDWWCSDNFY